jgi:malonyl-CoA O-methyltransferase
MADKTVPLPAKAAIKRSFGRAAGTYHAAAVMQKEVCARLAERLSLIRLNADNVLDMGAGTGFATPLLKARYPQTNLVSLDLAPEMLSHARALDIAAAPWLDRVRGKTFAHYAAGDAERLPIKTASLDLVFSSLTLQWCDPRLVFAEVARTLKDGGLFMFATVGPDTLRELRAAFAKADGQAHVNVFIDMHDLGDALVHAGFADPVMDMEHITMTYTNVEALARDLKAIGAHNMMPGRPQGLVSKSHWQAVKADYERHRSADGQLPATYEIVYGHAWKIGRKPKQDEAGRQIIEFRDYPRKPLGKP